MKKLNFTEQQLRKRRRKAAQRGGTGWTRSMRQLMQGPSE
jgi:hypothetical protein